MTLAGLLATVILAAVLCWSRVRLGGSDVLWATAEVIVILLWITSVAMVFRRTSRWPRLGLMAGAALLTPALLVAGVYTWLLIENTGTPGEVRAHGTDALWLGHPWADGRRTPADMDALVGRVRAAGIRDLYVHVGPLADDGSLDPALRPTARQLVDAVHKALPQVRVQAWLGDVVAADRMNLDDPATRTKVLASAENVLAEGFNGIHYDFEPVAEGNQGLLDLLASTHTLTRGHNGILSVATNQIEPIPGAHLPGQLLFGRPHWWSPGYLREVAGTVDQIAIMTYDTAIPSEAAYSGYLKVQTRLALQAVPDNVDLIIGIPAYHETDFFHTKAETVTPAIRGLRLGLGDTQRTVGASLYLDVTATDDDWANYLKAEGP